MSAPPGLSPVAWRALLCVALAAVSACLAFGYGELGDYPHDAGPAVDALAAGHLSAFLSSHPDMGAVTILLRAPVVAVAGGSDLAGYEWGALACLLATGALGVYLAGLAGRRGAGWPAQALIAGLTLLNPLTIYAVETGHPEEMLTAALVVAAVVLASDGREIRAAVLLGLAIASKQWAVLGVLPVLMALPRGRVHAALGAAGIAILFTLPFLLANPDGFLTTHRSLAFETQDVTGWSVWFRFADTTQVYAPIAHARVEALVAPQLLQRLAHPLIVAMAVVLPLALAWRRGRFRLSGADAMALMALIGLLRCALDPVDNLYYHYLFMLALIGWDALDSEGLPIRGLAAASAFEILARWQQVSAVDVSNALYVGAVALTAALIARALFGPSQAKERGRRSAAKPSTGMLASSPATRS